MSKKSSRRPPKQPTVKQTVVNPDAAGIDLASEVHYVAVPADRDPQPVRHFGSTTDELFQFAFKMRLIVVGDGHGKTTTDQPWIGD